MFDVLIEILNWSEVWALLVPLAVLLVKRKQPHYVQPVIAYLFIALLLDIVIDIGALLKKNAPFWMYPNNYIYNIHSIVRFICFGWFFSWLHLPNLKRLNKILPFLAFTVIIINFLFFEKFYVKNSFSSFLFALESGILLFYCLQYYIAKMQEDSVSKKQTDYYIVTGLSIYVVINFFYFLLYTTLLKHDISFAMNLWYLHNITFIILCIFIAKAFYVSPGK